jgi:cellulose synthase operon protein C
MRLACEHCAAAYIIDDGAMTPRGVRAQCPRCRNIQYVPPPVDPKDKSNPASRAQQMAKPISESRPPVPGREPEPEPPTQVARMALNTRMVTRPPTPPPEALQKEGPEAREELFGELNWNDGEHAESEGAPVPSSAATLAPPRPAPAPPPKAPTPPRPPPAASPESARAAPPGPPAKPFRIEEFFEATEAPAPAVAARASPTCASCGGPLKGLEDLASGVCTHCREAAAAQLAPVVTPPSPLVRPVTDPPHRLTSPPRMVAPPRRRWGVLAALVAVVALGVVAVLWLRGRGGVPARLQAVPVRHVDPKAPLPTGLAQRLTAWRTADTGPSPGAKTTLVEAEREIALDQPAAYASAERRLERALVDAPQDADLLGAWLTAVALGRGAADAADYRALLELGTSAADASGRSPPVLLGLAELLLAGNQPDAEARARALALEALGSDPLSVQGRLVLARTYVRTSADLALAALQKAELADPSQRRIPLLRAEAHAANGEPREALAALQARLALEPGHARSLFATGRLLVEVGESDQARRLFERLQADPRTEDGPALLALAGLDTLQGRPRDAVLLLRSALKRERLTPQARLRANVLLANALRAAGDAGASATAARAALAVDPADAGAHLELLLLALDKGDGGAAEGHLPFLVAKLGDPGLEGMLQGWVLMAKKQPAEAAQAFAHTVESDSRRTDGMLWAAAAQAAASNRADALAMLAAAEEADPTRAGPFSPLSDVSVRPEESLRSVEAPLSRLAKGPLNPQPLIGQAVLRFHRRDFVAADTALQRALKLDAAQPQALAWRALVLLERGEVKGAQAAAQLAQQNGRSLPIVQYASGAAALVAGDFDGARRFLREAVQLAPSLLAAQVKLAEAEAHAGAVSAARERLRKVVQIDPSYASAKRALYLLPKES